MGIPLDTTEWRLIGTYQQQKGVGPGNKVLGPLDSLSENCPDDFAAEPVCPKGLIKPDGAVHNPVDPRVSWSDHGFGNPANTDPKRFTGFLPQIKYQDNYQLGLTGHVSMELPTLPLAGDTQLGAVGGYYKNDGEGIFDFDGTNIGMAFVHLNSLTKQRSVELFLKSIESEYVDWKAGFFYYREKAISNNLVLVGGTQISSASTSLDSTSETESLGGYGWLSFWLTDSLKLLGGLRYSHEAKEGNQVRIISPGTQVRIISPGTSQEAAPDIFNLNEVWTAWQPRVEFTWNITDTSHVTVGATRGFKPGGFNLTLEAADAAARERAGELDPAQRAVKASFDAETVWQYQIASKNQLFDEELTLNLTLFWTKYDDYQACQVESTWTPLSGLQINANFNFLDTELKKFEIADPTRRGNQTLIKRDVAGNSLPRSPRFSVNTGIQYEIELGEFGFLTPRFQFRWQDRSYFRVFNRRDFSQPPYHWADVRLTWRSADERWTIETFLNNVTDVDVINNILLGPTTAGAPVLAFYREPRTWGIRFSARWF
jgi:iron complex outermembrane receptor protein